MPKRSIIFTLSSGESLDNSLYHNRIICAGRKTRILPGKRDTLKTFDLRFCIVKDESAYSNLYFTHNLFMKKVFCNLFYGEASRRKESGEVHRSCFFQGKTLRVCSIILCVSLIKRSPEAVAVSDHRVKCWPACR